LQLLRIANVIYESELTLGVNSGDEAFLNFDKVD
jgi:hypothetical protein